ncbi:hypothetical protein G9C98_004631 [Cotesia typhae]|uniref:Uncharacterized protein n=1 Tax=Cotesia typhae TaxID=2053667 RepID=A0A8J5QX76_9HYME|nr:hypothetical protein G9C98_004631 [Cotesia typhae]
MFPYKGRSISVQCFDLLSAYSMCHFKKTDYVISQYENLLGFLMCNVKSRKHKVLLAGVLSRVNKLTLDSYKREIDLKFENVDDLGEIIREKMRNWLAENPELNTYRLF